MLRTREDLPVARRQQATKRPRPFPIGPVVLSVSLALGGGLAALFLLQEQLLERWIPPAGLVEGIEARPDGDGRLLGHFPIQRLLSRNWWRSGLEFACSAMPPRNCGVCWPMHAVMAFVSPW